jgi:hypothetical protein
MDGRGGGERPAPPLGFAPDRNLVSEAGTD